MLLARHRRTRGPNSQERCRIQRCGAPLWSLPSRQGADHYRMDKPSNRAFLGERRFRLELRRKGLLVRSFSNSYFPISFVLKASILQVPDLGGSISVVVIASVVV